MQAKYQRVRRSIGFGRGFTLLELMIVVGIMGVMGTISVGSYRAMRRGMEERGVMQNVNQFIRNAYQRAVIDRQPTAIYFWNETIQEESDDGTHSLTVVGHAVAVRRAGRITSTDGGLFDEFGDLEFLKGVDDEGEEEDESDSEGVTAYLYRCNGDETSLSGSRSVVSPSTIKKDLRSTLVPMLSDTDWGNNSYSFNVYGYKQKSGFSGWKVGDAYGFEFADITLPNNYIFGTAKPSEEVDNPITEVSTVLKFSPVESPSGETIDVSAMLPDSGGNLAPKRIGTTESPDVKLSQQNK